MLKFIDGLKQGLGIAFVLILFVFGLYLVKGWNGLQATDGDVLTAAKWNELVSKVNGDITCPTGFTKIESQGRVYGCIQTDRNPVATFQNAIIYCHNNYGGRLPFYDEIYIGIQKYPLSNKGLNFEWLNTTDYWSNHGAAVIDKSINNYRPDTILYSNTNHYRCFIPIN